MKEQPNKLYFFPVDHISISSLQSFQNCPFSFYMHYYLGIKAPEKEAMTFGKQFQELLNAYYRGLDTKKVVSAIEPTRRGLASLLLAKAYDFPDIISIDEPYEVDLGFGIPIMFVPDLLTKTTIIENKCSSGYYNDKMVKDEKQATVYFVGVKKKFGFTPEIKYQIFNTKDKTNQLVDSPRTSKDIDDLMDWIEVKLKQIERCFNTDNWDTGEHKFCNFKDICPLQDKYGFKR